MHFAPARFLNFMYSKRKSRWNLIVVISAHALAHDIAPACTGMTEKPPECLRRLFS